MPDLGDIQAPQRWPLVSPMSNRFSDGDRDGKLVNCYAELNPATGGYEIVKRPGLGSIVSPTTPAGIGNGVYLWESISGPKLLFHVVGNVLYKNTVALGAPLTAVAGIMRWTPMRAIPQILVFGDGISAYYTDGTTVTKITDINFPTQFCPGIVYLDGTLYVMTPRANILGTANLDDPIVWSALNRIEARIEPDRGVALAKQLNYVIALKQWTTEVFYDAGNPTGSPLKPIEGAMVNYGCADADSLQDIDGTLIWVTNNRHLQRQVILMNALQTEIVSTPPLERLLVPGVNNTFNSCTLKISGHRFYVLDCLFADPTQNITLVFDLDQKLWYYWNAPDGSPWGMCAASYNANLDVHIIQRRATGTLYAVQPDREAPGDLQEPFPVDIYTPNYDGGVDRLKQLDKLYCNADIQPGSYLYARCNDSDYDPGSWTNFRRFNLGLRTPTLNNCGSFYRRAYHFRHLQLTPFRIRTMGLEMGIGTR